jgi:hypothetical protein
VVPAEAVCILSDATVNGNIETQSGSLFLVGNVTVNGNIESQGGQITALINEGSGSNQVFGNVDIDSSNTVAICGSSINGDVAISNTNPGEVAFGGSEVGATCSTIGGGNIIGGNVTITKNNVTTLGAADNIIGGNMTITYTLGAGTKQVINNKVTGNLQCSNNDQPFVSAGNQAKQLTGQCKP